MILFLNLAFSSLCLVPGQAERLPAIETIGLVGAVWVVLSLLHRHTFKHIEAEFRPHAWFNMTMGQLLALSWFLGGLALFIQGEAGLGWLIPSILFSYVLALFNAWVLLVEINR